MTSPLRFRDVFAHYLPPWLSNRFTSGLVTGYSYLWSMIAPADAAMEVLIEGLQAAWPRKGTPTALAEIGRSRGLIRGQGESDEDYGARLISWLELWPRAGSAEALCTVVQSFLSTHPRVRVVNRAGRWVTLDELGVFTTNVAAFDWDSLSNPERAGFWSEMWIIVYPAQWDTNGTYGDGELYEGSDGTGHNVTQDEYEAIKGLLSQWKSAHSRVRAVIFTTDPALFDPDNPLSLPDGTWGQWSYGTGGDPSADRLAGGREMTTCRYWEPA